MLMQTLLALALVAAGPSAQTPLSIPPAGHSGAVPVSKADAALVAFSARYLDDHFARQPVAASYVGYRAHDGKWPDYSEGGTKSALQMYEKSYKELIAIDKKNLSLPFAMDFEILTDHINNARFELNDLRAFEWDPQTYNEAVGAGFFYLTFEPKEDSEWPARLDNVLKRLETLPAFLAQAQVRLKNPSKLHTEFVMGNNPGNKEMLRGQIAALFQKHPDKKAAFDRLLPAAEKSIDDFQRFLEKEALGKAKHSWRLGNDLWTKKLRFSLQSKLSPKEVYAQAERHLSQSRARMLAISEQLFTRYYPEDQTPASLKGDARLNYVVGKVIERASQKHGTQMSLFSDVKKYSERAIAFIQKNNIVALPPANDNFVIEPTPPFLDGMAVAFFNPSPALEPWLKKSYWISSVPKTNTGDAAKDEAFAESFLREYNDYGLQTLTIHEAFPGHYVQLYFSQRSPHATLVKQVAESGTMAEGWAVMIEDVMYEQGYAEGELENELFHLKMNLRTSINAMIDNKLHTSTESEDKLDKFALDLMTQQGFQEEAEAKRKLRRAKLSSTQLSTYFVGYREMRSIFDAALKKTPGPVRPILDRMLSYGTIAPRQIEASMRAEGAL